MNTAAGVLVEGPDTTRIEALADEAREVWEASVDEIDASVALEVDGVNEAAARARFGTASVHDLATRLVELVPARATAEPASAGGPSPASVRLVLRGVLFVLPGLFYLVLLRSGAAAAAPATLGSVLLGWGLSQGVAAVAYRMIARADPWSVAVFLRRVLIAVVVLVAAGCAAGWSVPAGGETILVASGQLAYLIAGGVLLFYDDDRLLAAALVPGSVCSALFLAHHGLSAHVTLAVVGGSILCTVAVAIWSVERRRPAPVPGGQVLRHGDLTGAVPFVLNGIFTGAIVAVVPIGLLVAPAARHGQASGLVIAPLVLSMGVAELVLTRLYRQGRIALHQTRDLAGYSRRVITASAVLCTGYLVVLSGLSAAFAAVLAATSGLTGADVVSLSAYTALGIAVVQALLLSAIGRVWQTLGAYAGCAAFTALLAAALSRGHAWPSLEAGFLILCLSSAVVTTLLAMRALRDPMVFA